MDTKGDSSESIYQKRVEGGYTKVYPSGVVGYQPLGQPHSQNKEAMKPLKKVTASNNNLISKHFGE